MRYWPSFRKVIPHSKVGRPRVTHPFATLLMDCSTFAFDLHVLGTPPALILSQDQTLKLNLLFPLSLGLAASLRVRNSLNSLACLIGSRIQIPAFAPYGATAGP